jgi:hypothetical protein
MFGRAPSGRRALAADSAAIGRHGERGVGGAGCVWVVVIGCRALSDIGDTCSFSMRPVDAHWGHFSDKKLLDINEPLRPF